MVLLGTKAEGQVLDNFLQVIRIRTKQRHRPAMAGLTRAGRSRAAVAGVREIGMLWMWRLLHG